MIKKNITPKLEFGRDSIAIYTAFRDEVYSPNSVLYPSCGYDASPSIVFRDITFVDSEEGNKGCVKALKKHGLNAIKQDIREYRPEQAHDLLILLNPAVHAKWATKHLSSGGWLIANNYHHTASQVYTDNKFSLWGAMDFLERDRRKSNFKISISRDIGSLFEPVKNMEEFRIFRPNDYEFTLGLIESWTRQGLLHVRKNATLEEKFRAYREEMKEEMPSKRVALMYIFLKK
ncbi:hypothetical protein J4461_02850 [Candidatus Pacearchaeota archaeon]|nr:hypothetical protein [Candidatus Pacearchaeota archaeon]